MPKDKKIDAKKTAVKKAPLTKIQKEKLAHTKMRLHDATQEIRINSDISKEIKKRQTGSLDTNDFSIVKTGIKNKYAIKQREYQKALKALEVAKESGSEKDVLQAKAKASEAKLKLSEEQKVIAKEVKQVNKLNGKSKGLVRLDNEQGNVIDIRGMNKIYSSKNFIFKALSNVNLSIKRGSFNVILGPSGSGKTTLLNALSGLDRATYGDIIIEGVNLSALTTGQLTQMRRNKIGFVFQSYNLLPSLNVSDNIEIGRSLQTDANKRKNIKALLESIDMGGSKKKKTYELSGGQQQRVSIARALAKSPNILIGDEPTGALDQLTSLKVFELFQEINKTQNTTVIIVTHNVNVAKLADQVIHVKNGKIDEVIQNANPVQAKTLKEI